MAQFTSKSGRKVKPTEKMAQLLMDRELHDIKLQLQQQTLENELLRTRLEITETEEKLRIMSATASVHRSLQQPNENISRSSYSLEPKRSLHARSPTPKEAPDSYYAPAPALVHVPFVQSRQGQAPAKEQTPARKVTFAPRELTAEVQDFEPMYYSTPRSAYTDGSAQRHATIGYQPDSLVDMSVLNKLTLPKLEPEVFSGDLLNFPIWIKSFEALIETNTTSPSERLYFLSKYTAGEAKQAIRGFFVQDGNSAYIDAKRTLISRYGDKFRAAEAFKYQIHSWPIVKAGDGEGLRKLADYLEHCNSAMSTLRHLQSLDSADENKKILKKLPRHICDRWNRVIDRWLYGTESERYCDTFEGRYPPFAEFCKFISNESRIACGPGNIHVTEPNDTRSKPSGGNKQRNAGSFASNASVTATKDSPSTKASSKNAETVAECSICSESHVLHSCERFKALTLEERQSHATKRGLCFGCLRWGHIRQDCRRKGRPLLYIGLPPRNDKQPEANESTPQQEAVSYKINVSTPEEFHHSLIVPVVIYHKEMPMKQVTTYALLDNQSNACFITEPLISQFNPPAENVNLKLTTMTGQKVLKSKILHGLVVRGIGEQAEINLPGTYTRDDIPADPELIPRPESVRRWSHLKEVSEKLHPYDEDMDVGLLIGFNCSAALLPRQVIAAGDDDPYAMKTALGWGVTGAMNADPNRRHVSQGNNHFAFRTHAKEVTTLQIKEMYELEFNEGSNKGSYSMDDVKFLKQAKEGIKHKDGHFELPLPFKDEVKLPNNKSVALKRFNGLKVRLMKNEQYLKDYVTFMNDLIEKGYAEKVPEDQLLNEPVWYIPHHGVYHPKKPGKIRVVFDCSAQYKGESLNHHLLQGPDQINSLTGVLCRFRQDKVAFVCDIEGMFHQVSVMPKHRDFLRFLWSDNNLPPSEYRMTVHLFGATSSPGCANYALKTTADIYEKECGKDAADFVRRNFYVDDGLKSTASEAEARKLIHDSREMCKQGGFNLHKFACTHRDVLNAIPAEQRAKDIQNLDLSHERLPISRTLGVEWCIEQDEFRFRIDMKDSPVTRRKSYPLCLPSSTP